MLDVNENLELLDKAEVWITAENYRCFTVDSPLILRLQKGFTSFVGCNNVGKTAILRLFFEIRPILEAMFSNNNPVDILDPERGLSDIGWRDSNIDPNEMFNSGNSEDMSVTIEIRNIDIDSKMRDPTKVEIVIRRDDKAFNKVDVAFYANKRRLSFHGKDIYYTNQENQLRTGGSNSVLLADFTLIYSIIDIVERMVYIPTYRHSLGIGDEKGKYYDIKIGREFIESWVEITQNFEIFTISNFLLLFFWLSFCSRKII